MTWLWLCTRSKTINGIKRNPVSIQAFQPPNRAGVQSAAPYAHREEVCTARPLMPSKHHKVVIALVQYSVSPTPSRQQNPHQIQFG